MKRDRTDQDWQTLWRFVALLFAMAATADRASAGSPRARHAVLHYLCQAEAMIWSMALEDLYGILAPHDLLAETFARGNRPADAAHLAVIFRALALILVMRFALYRSPKDGPDDAADFRVTKEGDPADRCYDAAHSLAAPPAGRLQPAFPP